MMVKIWMHGDVKHLSQNERMLTSMSLLECLGQNYKTSVCIYVYKIDFETTS